MRLAMLVFSSAVALSLFASLAAADPASPVGRWVFEESGDRRVLVLRADGRFELSVRRKADAALVGGHWTAVGGRLVLDSDEASVGRSETTLTLEAGRLTLDRIPSEGEPMVYRRDMGVLAGRWVAESGALQIEFLADGTFQRSGSSGTAVAGTYDVSYVEPEAARGSLVLRLPGEAPTPVVIAFEDEGRRLTLSDPGAATPAFVLRRAHAAKPPPVDPATSFSGRWRGTTANGPIVFDIEQTDDALRIASAGETSAARVTAPGRAEGAETGPMGEVRFTLVRRGAALVAQFILVAEDGSRNLLQEIVFERERSDVPPSPGAGFAGRWESRGAGETSVMVIEDRSGGSFVLTSDGSSTAGRLSAAGRLEGAESTDGATVSFSFEVAGDELTARFTIAQADGSVRSLDPIVFERRLAPRPDAGAQDPTLVGHWRFTSVEHFVMDFNLVLAADGTYRWWVVPSDDAPETGIWRTEGRRLFLRATSAAAERLFGAYALGEAGAVMLITRPDGQKRPYQRQ